MKFARGHTEYPKPPSLRPGRLGLNLCHQPTHDSCFQTHGVDIITVHDYNPPKSGGTESWVNEDGHSWIHDVLPSDMPNARIWTFNYRSDENTRLEPLAVALTARINIEIGQSPNSSRPIVFIGLGLGGTIIKLALLRARVKKGSENSVYQLTRGIVFLGTRHAGNSWDFVQDAKLKQNVLRQIRKHLMFLEDPEVEKTNRIFRSIKHDYQIACCFANKPVGIGGTRVFPVPEKVATYDDSENILRDVSQPDLGKFNPSDDHEYKHVLTFLKQHEREAPSRTLTQAPLGALNQNTPPTQPIHGLKLLCLDGGGVRGLSSLLVLKDLMFSLQKKQNLKDLPRPCEQFDLICGTSTGGLIAIMLGRLRMDVTSCIVAYRKLSRDIFKLNNPQKLAKGAWNWGRGNGIFSAKALERAIAEILNERLPIAESTDLGGPNQEASLRDPLQDGCKIFVCAVNTDTHEPVRLRSFEIASDLDEGNLSTCKIIEAARATSAAPTYFPVARIGPSTFYDGAMRNNNPVLEMIQEISSNLGDLPVQCLVSIGTGTSDRDKYKPGMFQTIKAVTSLVTDTEGNHGKIMSEVQYEDLRPRYLRFNVEGLGKVGLSGWKMLPYIESETKNYLREQPTREELERGTALMTARDAGVTSEGTD